jgi:hypothetical protein
MSSIAELAKLSLTIEDFNLEDFIIERAFADVDKHVSVGRFTIVYVDRPDSIEDDSNFADGGNSSASGDIRAIIYWLIDGERFEVGCKKTYYYSIHGHSGGISDYSVESTKFTICPGDILMTEKEFCIAETISLIATMTREGGQDAVEIYKNTEYDIPRKFINYICDKLSLHDSAAHLYADAADDASDDASDSDDEDDAAEEDDAARAAVMKTWNDWMVVKKAKEKARAEQAAAERKARKEKEEKERAKSDALWKALTAKK